MRFSVAALASCCVIAASPASGEQDFPYKAFITADEVYVRSGPGQDYYPTDKLKTGQRVEVYRHDPGGWYAVRPVQGSFSWVSARYLELQPDKLARVVGDRVAARVGTRFSDIRSVIQVRLNRDELVEILGTRKQITGTGTATWYKIAPPSGEFRWISGKFVDRAAPGDGVRRTHSVDRVESPAADYSRVTLPLEDDSRRPAAPRDIAPEQFQAELEELGMELSVMVAEEPTVWEFGEMRLRADSLLTHAETALERGRARLVVGKISRFAEIKHRLDKVAALQKEAERTDRQIADLSPRKTRPGGDADDRFDGMGKLTRVESSKLGAPRYALIDELGHVRSFVSPAPGVRLRNYLGRRVGINGTRGYMPQQRAHHIMAKHVNLVDDNRLR
jgi:SH3-like domain-containing protein